MGKRLISASHDAETDVLIAALHEGGNDGMERALASGEQIGMPGLKSEQRAAILHDEAHTLRSQPRPEFIVDAFNPARDIALFVDDSELSGVAAHRVAIGHVAVGLFRVDERSAFFRIVLR